MRQPHLLACTLAVLSAHAYASTGAPVTAVTLYPGSASVVRTAQVAAGATEVVVTGLPANFDARTMQARGGPGIQIGDVTLKQAANGEALNPVEAAQAGKVEALQDQLALIDAEIASANIVKGYLERLGGKDDDGKGAGGDVRGLGNTVQTLGRSASDTLLKIQKLNVQRRELAKKLDAANRDLARLQSGTRDTRSVTVAIAASREGTVTLTYQLSNAGWKPGYRAGLDTTASTLELDRLATVSQATGEDWSNVKLTLSTSQPQRGAVGSNPQSWLLAWYPPAPPEPQFTSARAYAPAPMAPPAPVVMAGGKIMDRAKPTMSFVPLETIGNFATEFQVPGRVTLPSDGRSVSLTLSTQKLAVRQFLRVAPRLDRFGVLMADAARPEGVWPSGEMQLFRDGAYIGATTWNLQDGERAQFAFGRDDLLKVSSAKVEGTTGSKGVFGGSSARVTADVFTLVNLHKTPMDVVVLEASPVSTAQEVKVQSKFSPQPAEMAWEKKRGVVAWKQKLAAGETANFNVEYEIAYPKEGEVVGLR